ncbi:MAG TPA: hypothetical protein VKR42_12530, partial [Ktedonobacteraceae bacterium]|nr:hypothetical protein [Ktedonobacteraceae bacterium]
MKEQSLPLSLEQLNALFEQLNPLDVEQFYTAYQLWSTRQRIQTLQAQIEDIQLDIVENAERLEQVHPSALALATLARLQSNGVSNVDVLDRMLERGEEWLDRTMQRLEYCEKLDVISGDYTKWCELALEGAYDWIDSMLGQDAVDVAILPPALSATPVSADHESLKIDATHENGEPASAIMEELFLQKLMSDDREEMGEVKEGKEFENDTPLLETTLKMDALLQSTRQESVPEAENAQPAPSALPMLPTEPDTRPEAVDSTPVLAEVQAEHTEVTSMAVEEQEEHQPALLHMEDRHEIIEQPEIVVETLETQEAQDTLEPVNTNEPHMELSLEQEAGVPVAEHSEQPEESQTGQ